MRTQTTQIEPNDDQGFSLIELLIVIIVIGVLASIVVFSVRGITDDGQDTACSQHNRVLATAIESYFAHNRSNALPAVGAADGEEYERGLVQTKYMRDVSIYYAVNANGDMTPEPGSPCP